MRRICKQKECGDRPDPICVSRYDPFHICECPQQPRSRGNSFALLTRKHIPAKTNCRRIDCVNMEGPTPSTELSSFEVIWKLPVFSSNFAVNRYVASPLPPRKMSYCSSNKTPGFTQRIGRTYSFRTSPFASTRSSSVLNSTEFSPER